MSRSECTSQRNAAKSDSSRDCADSGCREATGDFLAEYFLHHSLKIFMQICSVGERASWRRVSVEMGQETSNLPLGHFLHTKA